MPVCAYCAPMHISSSVDARTIVSLPFSPVNARRASFFKKNERKQGNREFFRYYYIVNIRKVKNSGVFSADVRAAKNKLFFSENAAISRLNALYDGKES